ncbi:hypothetical protein [Mesorhizobium sp. LjRoot246]|uniref:hypothetical protein n=1 Tax=Mesorhizobium sp. LjRoot246 TaxID=3342294 RepID=UPI003ECC8211
MTNAAEDKTRTWRQALSQLEPSEESAFGPDFLRVYGERLWQPNDADRSAAHSLHVELISRIATQTLSYSEGVEERALGSLFRLFERGRKATDANPGGATFETLFWHVLNSRVRPFTAKWHPQSASGALRALDSSDEFRAGLADIQGALVELDKVLQSMGSPPGYIVGRSGRPDRDAIDKEMAKSVHWRPMGATSGEEVQLAEYADAEKSEIAKRRDRYGLDAARPWAAGLALSGGGIRSATFSMGVMVSLAKRNLLHQFDYLSSVSGGGYAAAFLTQLLGSASELPGFSLSDTDAPFTRDEGETLILRRIRHGASYLSGSFLERIAVSMAQAQGIFINFLVLALVAAAIGYADFLLRRLVSQEMAVGIALISPILLLFVFVATPLVRKLSGVARGAETWMAWLGIILLLPILWVVLGAVHVGWQPLFQGAYHLHLSVPEKLPDASRVSAWLTALGSVSAVAGALLTTFSKVRPLLLTVLGVLFFVCLEALAFNFYVELDWPLATAAFAACALLWVFLWVAVDVNTTSLHAYYKAKLSGSFLIGSDLKSAAAIYLSDFKPELALFPIINCALNVPGSKNPSMRGRLSDIFSLTPIAVGAPVLGYRSTKDWEKANPNLDLATAMALSGAAISPQMGLRTTRYASFWLTLLNLRLGLWLKRPSEGKTASPGVRYLFRELTATADECGEFVNVSDGGHIENLGVYELLRRRCRFIVAVDGENDPKMTFHALTNLQRLAYIDFGIVLELDLDDLRLTQTGYSRSHFRFCRIVYPTGHQDTTEQIGYLIYLKLSLTGNEGEFLRRFKLDEPAFPHHSTADQFFSEPQFEAYRALGEHVGEKLFLPAIVGQQGLNVDLEDWFRQLGRSLLDVRPAATGSKPAATP